MPALCKVYGRLHLQILQPLFSRMNTDQPKRGQPPKDGVPAIGQIQLRVTMARKNAYVRAAKPRKLTAWIFEHLDKAASYEPPQPPRQLDRTLGR